jgi:hypothetical protein
MSGRCFRLRRKLVPYLDGEIPPRAAARLERHLAGCRGCGDLLARLRAGHEAGRELGRVGPEAGPGPRGFDELWAEVGSKLGAPHLAVRSEWKTLRGLTASPALRTFVALALAGVVVLLISDRNLLRRGGDRSAAALTSDEFNGFRPVRIAEFPSQGRSRVSTEGFVRDVYFDEQEKTLHIKLVERPQKSEPFVICEIPSPDGMALPREGSRIRVYGMSRYDPQPGRGWNEVNPVLTLAVLKR